MSLDSNQLKWAPNSSLLSPNEEEFGGREHAAAAGWEPGTCSHTFISFLDRNRQLHLWILRKAVQVLHTLPGARGLTRPHQWVPFVVGGGVGQAVVPGSGVLVGEGETKGELDLGQSLGVPVWSGATLLE